MNNIPLYFNYNVNDIIQIEKDIIEINNQWLESIKEVKNPYDFLNSYIYLHSKFDYIYNAIIFLKDVSPQKEIREASIQFHLNLNYYFLNFFKSNKNYQLFLILKKIKKNDKNNIQKLIRNIFKSFEDNGVHLNKKDKKEYIKIDKKLIFNENLFSDNINNDIQNIKYFKNELQDIKESNLRNHKINGYYIFNTTYPDEKLIMKNCSIDKSREKMYIHFHSVAKENLTILKNIIQLRYQKSKIFGFKNSMDYYLSYNRLATKNKINSLLNRFIPILKKKCINDYSKLLFVSNKKELYDYDLSYYSNLYKKKYLNYDDNKIKFYFTSSYTIPKILKIYGDLFKIKITKIQRVHHDKIWHESVNLYEVKDKLKKNILGYFYVDLYPREGKFTHAGTFSIQNSYRDINNRRIIPVTAIICNFTPIQKNHKFSFLTFNEVVTFCHELGHAFHNILSNVKYESLSGISMEDDFAEMPSQFFENWCYEKDFLKKISKHYKTGRKMNNSLINIIIKNKHFLNSIDYLTQILYIKYDLGIHSKNKITKEFLYKKWFNLCKELLPFKITKNTYPMCRFGHLIDYASGYYGYLWSLIYSYDAFDIFKKRGILNSTLGYRFRKEILEKGGTIKGTIMLKNFLRRKLSTKFFFSIFNQDINDIYLK